MMSANEFFDCGPEPPWLVDACGGEVVSPNSELEFSYHISYSSVPYLELNHGTEAGPSNSAMNMDLDEEHGPNDHSFAYNYREEFNGLRQEVNSSIQSVRPAVPLSVEQRRSWLNGVTPNVPNGVPTRGVAPAPALDLFFRACKKRKRSHG